MDNTNSSMSVFLTNASNALGRELTRKLAAKGHRVTGVTMGSDGAARVRADGGIPAFADLLRAGELKSAMIFAKPDVVIHTAAMNANHIPVSGADWEAQAKILTEGTAALVEAAQATGVKFLVYPSYAFIYGDTHGEWVDESAPRLNPNNMEETAVFRAIIQGEDAAMSSSVPGCVLRAGFIYSAEDAEMQALYHGLKGNKPVILGKAGAVANWVQAADMAQVVVLAAEQQPTGQVFNVSDNAPASPVAFVNYFAEAIGLPHPGQPPAFVKPLLSGKVQRVLLDMAVKVRNEKAKEQLGWTPRYGDYHAGIEQALLAWRAEDSVK